VADNEPTSEVTTSAAELAWPDPKRPIINERDGGPNYRETDGQHDGGHDQAPQDSPKNRG
jgi:hypothetical protein